MIYFNMAIVIVATFLLSTLVVGIYFSKKKPTFREYAVGNKQFTTATLVATVLATFFEGGGLVRNVECIHDLGLWFIVVLLIVPFGMCTISKLSLRMGPFMQHFSTAETMGSIYGRYPRFITVLVSICRNIVLITSQIIIMSHAISMCVISSNPYIIPIFSTLILIFYSMFGGVRVVTFTDVFQFITFAIIIPLLSWFMFVNVEKPVATIIPILQNYTKFQFNELLNTKLIGMLLLLLADMPSNIVEPALMQRVYMASSPTQAQKVFWYASVFGCIIQVFIILIGLFTFVGAPDLPKEEIWSYIVTHIPPLFKGFITISLLAMAMSTADSALNTCSVMVGHDIVQSLQKEIPDTRKLTIAKTTTLIIGLLSMMVAFKCNDLLKLVYWSLDCSVPILTAPFILAILGFRSSSSIALIGMTTGLLTILAWNKWLEPIIEIDGAFVAMLANGFAMLAAHYLLKQPDGSGWVKPDNVFKQLQQENARKRTERKEAIKNAWANRKNTLANLITSDLTLYLIGLYAITTAILSYWFIRPDCIHAALCQVVVGAFFIVSKAFLGRILPNWFINLVSLITLAIYLPLKLIANWWDMVDPIFSLALSLTHSAVILWILPLYLAIGAVTTTFLGGLFAFGWSFALFASLWPLLLAGLCMFSIIVYFKTKINKLTRQNIYLKDQKKITASQQLKASLYEAALVPSTRATSPRGYGSILAQVVRKVEESISFLDNHTPLYKEDFQTIIHKLYDWIAYFNSREAAKAHALLQPNNITLDKLIRTVEVSLSQEIEHPPKLLVKKIKSPSNPLATDVVCDIHQVTYALVKIILRMGKLTQTIPPIVKVALHPTALQFKQADGIGSSGPVCIDFQAIALVISPSTVHHTDLPKVKGCYDPIDCVDLKEEKQAPPSIDLEQDTLSSVVRAHYGYLDASLDEKKIYTLMVFPIDVTDILDKMTARLPIDSLTREAPITPKEQADSMMKLMQFHDYVCKASSEADPIDVKIISGILLLLRKHFGFKRHISGQLFYVRAVGIAQLVIDWVFHSPKVVYAALLYGLVRCTCLPLSYIKEHYNLGVYVFVSNVIKIDKREELDHPSLLYVQNRLAQAIKEEHVQLSVLFIKLAERLYDLRHAAGYIHLTEVKHMAQETLNIDVQIAHTYLDPAIGQALEKAAKEALKLCTLSENDQHN
ncbi:sodium:solute symporter family transporter [Cardinium endosymbiont of Bemisia tabaci]|uniref:sodium:solute symporter family transporter n=1 Tax=Cardinium endosymbiont of Bemisia tabaci TaxID=672794 RepID=UPI000442D208|nr:HD domain-containing protein [Cardinium endosymbiont of Bemisia tabaci]CDG50131.1 Sodium:solute symporter family protein [Cardinium endosymbiont cBtQ1 of Bemisia tabaci]